MSQSPSRPTQSLTNQLIWSLFLRQVVFVTVLNLVVICLSLISLVVWAEGRCTEIATLIDQEGLPQAEVRQWMLASPSQIILLDRPPQGADLSHLPGLSPLTQEGLRNFQDFPLLSVEFPQGQTGYAIQINLSPVIRTLRLSGTILLLVELFFLFSSILGNDRSIRHNLRPIQDLADTTFRLNAQEPLSQREMEALAGQLDRINATHLDSRINLPATQRELRTLAQAINAMLDRVSQAYSVQMQFVSDASHELRTPIAVIQGYSALLDRWGKTDPDTLQEAIDAIRSEAKSMEYLMEQLLFLARGDNQSQTVEKEEMELTSLAAQVLKEEEMLFPQHQLLPLWDEEVTLVADPNLMKQLLRILLDNSLKYTPSTGRVWLKIQEEGSLVTLVLEDEGMGIPPEALPHIFQRFYRTDRSRARQTGGTGLGLSIAQWIVSQHQGWVDIISREELGTRITVSFPVVPEEAVPGSLTKL